MFTLRVRSIRFEAEGIYAYDLEAPEGGALPPVEAGAHLEIHAPGVGRRRYSLCNAPGSTDHYRIAVLNVRDGRGGSRAMHERVRPGDLLEVVGMHNYFTLDETAPHTLLLGAGIGITPLLAMAERLHALGRPYALHYCTRSPQTTAFASYLAQEKWRGRVFVHHDGGTPGQGLDIPALLAQRPEDGQLYFCGPPGFMRAVRGASSHWPAASVHSENFGAEPPATADIAPTTAGGLGLRLEKSGRTVPVGTGQTLLQALRAAGVPCRSSCEAGLCGECKLRHLSGAIEHNDYILSETERQESVLVCCARVRAGIVVLDI
ncbi:MAG: PDR/VanB family oxidoreductase [Bordetella sp.]|nr:PDR/VanB family oxidoreductase [Bordetella sp.]